ncbi:MAG: class II fructose-bisphosphatase [Verrucomicrobiaceae bacterium]|nr:class II fructose-bisphosphatase [Verrucomicrobiaceae bacterium]
MSSLPPLLSTFDLERVLEFEFVRATENAALQAIHWLGRGEKELADGAACAAIYGVFDILDIRGEVVIGEGIKDNAPGIFIGEHLGTWREGSPRFDIALDPIDGTSNIAKGLPNSVSVIAAAQVPEGAPSLMKNLPAFYSHKIAYGPAVKRALEKNGDRCFLDMPLREVISFVADALEKRERDLVVTTMDRPRHADIIRQVRESGAALRMISDGDIAAAVAPSMPDAVVDLYVGIGGSPEGILAAAALKCLGGDMQLRMWPHTPEHRAEIIAAVGEAALERVYRIDDLIIGDSALFCATGISDSPLVPGCRLVGHRVETHSILMRARSGTVRRIHAVHDLDRKVVPLREPK